MNDKQTLLAMILAIGDNFILNLDSIPDDKFTWKPEPKAKSVAEVVEHLLRNFEISASQLGEATSYLPVNDIASAKAALERALKDYKHNLETINPEKLNELVNLGGNDVSLGSLAKITVIDTIHHHGQISYIQTLLGDDESHFIPDLFDRLK